MSEEAPPYGPLPADHMDDAQLLELMRQVDPRAVRVPPGLRAIVDLVAKRERAACAAICDDMMNGYDQPSDCAAAIRARGAP